MNLYVSKPIFLSTSLNTHMCYSLYVRTYVCMHTLVYVCVCMCVYIYVWVYVCMCTCKCVYMHVCVCTPDGSLIDMQLIIF